MILFLLLIFVVTNKNKLKTDCSRREVPRTFPDECTIHSVNKMQFSFKLNLKINVHYFILFYLGFCVVFGFGFVFLYYF